MKYSKYTDTNDHANNAFMGFTIMGSGLDLQDGPATDVNVEIISPNNISWVVCEMVLFFFF